MDSAYRISASAKPSSASRSHWSRRNGGTLGAAKCTSMRPTASMPQCGSTPVALSTTVTAISTSAAGTRGKRRISTSQASDTSVSATLGQCQSARRSHSSGSRSRKSPAAGPGTKAVNSCLSTMVADNPMVKPRSTGWAIRLDTVAPSPPTAATRKNTPAISTSPAASMACVMKSGAASECVAAISTAADDDVADTMAKRLLPTSPYTASPASSPTMPACGGSPAMAA